MKNCNDVDIRVGTRYQLKALEGPHPMVFGEVLYFSPQGDGTAVLELGAHGGFYCNLEPKVFIDKMVVHICR